MTGSDDVKTHYWVCDLCEAVCGLEIKVSGSKIVSIKGDKDDPLSHGHVCPKAAALEDKQFDPDRLRQPMKRTGEDWQPISWRDAIDYTADRLVEIQTKYGKDAVGTYFGNPAYHGAENPVYGEAFLQSLGTKNRYTVASMDQLPHAMVDYWLYGQGYFLSLPDIDRTQYLVVIGGNPLASMGSLMGAPYFKNRMKKLRGRGGKMVVIDPRRSETAEIADEHHFIRPESDTALLLGMLNTMIEEKLVDLDALPDFYDGLPEVIERVRPFTAERAAPVTGIKSDVIKRLAREFAAADGACLYGRIGTNTQMFGTTSAWVIEIINIVTGNLDRPGGMMFANAAFDPFGDGPGGSYNSYKSRVRGAPECLGELPVSVMAEEILTPGEGQIRAMVTLAGNPVLSFPNGSTVETALEQLEFMVSIDPYINESTRFADIILPPPGTFEGSRFDVVYSLLTVRNTARYYEPIFPKQDGALHNWEIFAELGEAMARRQGQEIPPRVTPEEMIDAGLRAGPYGEQSGHPAALTLEKLKESPHGIDMGPMEPCLPDRLYTTNKRIQCAVPEVMADLNRVESDLFEAGQPDELVLIGRRQIRNKNSWMHNYKRLAKGKDRCVLFMHPIDLEERQLKDGQTVQLSSRIGEISVPVRSSDEMMRGVVSLPHGWGHGRKGTKIRTANAHPGVSINDITDNSRTDPISGNAAFSGTPVTVSG
ncbi:MAG: molybdopterin-dependent oxidoreductase [Rhodospirillales bacterium]|nr:molybdopterin-dependent oxidoreductase [Rhodospirillales bacterium]